MRDNGHTLLLFALGCWGWERRRVYFGCWQTCASSGSGPIKTIPACRANRLLDVRFLGRCRFCGRGRCWLRLGHYRFRLFHALLLRLRSLFYSVPDMTRQARARWWTEKRRDWAFGWRCHRRFSRAACLRYALCLPAPITVCGNTVSRLRARLGV